MPGPRLCSDILSNSALAKKKAGATAGKGYFGREIAGDDIMSFKKCNGQIGNVGGVLYFRRINFYRLQVLAIDITMLGLMSEYLQSRCIASGTRGDRKRIRQNFHSGTKKIDSFEDHEVLTHFIRNFFSFRGLFGA